MLLDNLRSRSGNDRVAGRVGENPLVIYDGDVFHRRRYHDSVLIHDVNRQLIRIVTHRVFQEIFDGDELVVLRARVKWRMGVG